MGKSTKIIKASTLKKLGACPDQLHLFKKLFGKEVKLTKKLVLKHFDIFDVDWAVRRLCNCSAQLKYGKIKYSAWAEYVKTITPAIAPARSEYVKTIAPALVEYQKTKALAFYELYNGAIHD